MALSILRLRNRDFGLDGSEMTKALKYVDSYWGELDHYQATDEGTLIGLPYRYIIPSAAKPGAVFQYEEQYYWDSYFTALGLTDDKYQPVVEGMLENLLYLLKRFGIIPNASRMYFTGRSQPPLLTSFIFMVYDRYEKNESWLKERIDLAKKEYQEVWMSKMHPQWHNVFRGLSRYYDINVLHDLAEAESGWDMTPRFDRKCLDFLPVDLNALLYKYETDFARAAEIFGDTEDQAYWLRHANSRKRAMHELMWGRRRGFYFDYNYNRRTLGDIWSLAGFYPMWVGMVSAEDAEKMVRNLDKFEKKGGLTTTARPFIDTNILGSLKAQWAYPNGWAPLQYIVVQALQRYGYDHEANRIMTKWLTCNLDWFMRHKVFLEKYNVVAPHKHPVEGVYPSQTGFGWTNAIFSCFARELGLHS